MLIYLLAVLPFLISHRGLFFYYGDYNVQQVPFLIFAHRAVRQGRFFWNPLVDLGGNMGGTFAFYLWGSPFFWLTVPFPEHWLPYMMPYLMALKYGTAAAAACMWIRTQTRSDKAAALGALLYAFSGFQACNIVFQHFHDVTAFFPLYLLAFDRFVSTLPQGRDADADGGGRCAAEAVWSRVGFILMTAWMAVINYYFFFGQVIFLVLYYIVRRGIRLVRASGLRAAAGEVLRILGAGTAGLLLVSFFLVQSVGGILGNTRVSKVLSGYDLVVYPDAGTPLAILRTLFVVPDLIARGTVFTNENIRNGSLGFYLPCFAMAGVFAFWQLRRRSWKKTLLSVLAVMAFVPVLCASFSALNSNFYTRWFYMPVLLCACMTAEALEEDESRAFTRGTILSLAGTAFFLLCCFLPVQEKDGWSFTSIGENRGLLPNQIKATAFGAAALLIVLVIKRRRGGLFPEKDSGETAFPENGFGNRAAAEDGSGNRAAAEDGSGHKTCPEHEREDSENTQNSPGDTGEAKNGRQLPLWRRVATRGNVCMVLTVLCCLTSTMAVLDNGSSLISFTGFEKWKKQMLTERPVLSAEAEEIGEAEEAAETGEGEIPGVNAPFSRVETDSTSTNYELVWGIPTMHCFESTVHPSIFRWYRGIGMIRTVESTLPLERIGARAVMSVRYYLENTLVRKEGGYAEDGGMQGYTLLNDKNGYSVYETENYIPMGFSFDSYMTEDNYDLLKNGTVSDRVLVKNIVLSDEMAEKYGDLMTEDTDTSPEEMPYWEFYACCEERAESACSSFSFDRNGYHATARMKRDNLLLFSVPYDEGFRATIDGQPAEVERADFGLTAIFVPEGEHEIRVTYLPPGFVPACLVSLLTAAGIVFFIWRTAAGCRAARPRF
ncbi:MAG: YfhO family protein [Eubacteriales bacterium]|nr:YfhO family protein [Eubacteriales bacterium]